MDCAPINRGPNTPIAQQPSVTMGNTFQIRMGIAATLISKTLHLQVTLAPYPQYYPRITMVDCRGCGRKNLKRSGINLHCRKSRDPRCREYLEHLKQATAGIRSRQQRRPPEHSLTPTLNVSPSTGEVSQASNSHQVSKKRRTVQTTFVHDLELVTSKMNTAGSIRQGRMPFSLTSTIPSSMQGECRHP